MAEYNGKQGVWRTIGGRRIFIADGEDLQTAMKNSGKFKNKKEKDDGLPKKTEIKEQGTSNRKEVSENIQAHILEYYDDPQDFIEQMDYMNEPNKWRAGQKIAEGGSYLIYNDDMSDFLDSLKINPKGKKFDSDKAFQMYTSLVGRESAKLYERLKKRNK